MDANATAAAPALAPPAAIAPFFGAWPVYPTLPSLLPLSVPLPQLPLKLLQQMSDGALLASGVPSLADIATRMRGLFIPAWFDVVLGTQLSPYLAVLPGFLTFLGLLHLCLRLCLLPVLVLFHAASLTCGAFIVLCPPLCEVVCWLGRATSLFLLLMVHLLGPSFSLGLKQGGLEVAKGTSDACSGAGVAACAGVGVATTP